MSTTKSGEVVEDVVGVGGAQRWRWWWRSGLEARDVVMKRGRREMKEQ